MRKFIEKIQQADDDTKRWVLVVASAVAMAVVVCIWLVYFNNFITMSSNVPLAAQSPPSQNRAPAGTSFWGTMKHGAAILYGHFVGTLGWFGNVFNTQREYIVKPMK
jgi:hypothetical protein